MFSFSFSYISSLGVKRVFHPFQHKPWSYNKCKLLNLSSIKEELPLYFCQKGNMSACSQQLSLLSEKQQTARLWANKICRWKTYKSLERNRAMQRDKKTEQMQCRHRSSSGFPFSIGTPCPLFLKHRDFFKKWLISWKYANSTRKYSTGNQVYLAELPQRHQHSCHVYETFNPKVLVIRNNKARARFLPH